MPTRDLRPGHPEQWSQRNQTLRHGGEKRARDDESMLRDPTDYSAIGGPDDQRIYGYVRSDSGRYPWNQYGELQGRDAAANRRERGGYLKSVANWRPQRDEK